MDRETFHACCSVARAPRRRSYARFRAADFVDYIARRDCSYVRFFSGYLVPNEPCVLASCFTAGWRCRTRWVTAEGKPDFGRLLQDFDETPVPVANCAVKEYNSNPKQILPFKEFISYWKEYIQNGHSSTRGCLYLKDWHMPREFPALAVYSTPKFFSSDWLNEYWDASEGDDYRFVYMGPKGSWTPFHADVFRSYSWSANICGRKKWILYPPGQEEFLRDCHGNLAYDVTAPVLRDSKLYPRYEEAWQPLEIIQEAGEIIFIPSGWHHQVYNLEDTISINHNWLNGCNVDLVWQFLQQELSAVQREIGEWRSTMETWHEHCQVIMKSCTGIDYRQFASLLKVIAENRLSYLSSCGGGAAAGAELPGPSETLATLGPHHAAFDLQQVALTLELMLADDNFKRLGPASLGSQSESLLQRIRETLRSTL